MRAALLPTLLLLLTPMLPAAELPRDVGAFGQQVHRAYTVEHGLPSNTVSRVAINAGGRVLAETAGGTAIFDDGKWHPSEEALPAPLTLTTAQEATLGAAAGGPLEFRAVATHGDEWAVAADMGLYTSNGGDGWQMALPREGDTRWAPVDVRCVVYDTAGRLWFAAPQGVGYRVAENDWRLFTAECVPYNDFTCMAVGPGAVWFGTTNGAIRFNDGQWSFRQGGRWLLDNHVNSIAIDTSGNAWIATPAGVSCIETHPMTLTGKAAFFEEDIEQHHRRTPFGYVAPAELSAPGDRSTAVPVFTDNDGHFTGLYLGAVSLGYAATGREKLENDAHNAFRALSFLGEVTQGGTHPAPEGFIARAIVPTSGPDPNPAFDLAYDQRRNAADSLWKIIQPRWPVDESGEWYWKNDSSSDELDGHFFGYTLYFDHVCETEAEKDAVRTVVRRIVDHILDHGYNLVDYDGQPTRWGRFSPDDLNRNEAWCDERGLNSFSILTYLAIAHHVTGDPKYRAVYRTLALDHGYGMNGMTQFKSITGPGFVGHQPDDNMAFMNYYHLIRYETDPKLLSMYTYAIYNHWQHEKAEHNAFANFVYAACCTGKARTDQWGETDLTPPPHCLDDAIDALKRFPLDLVTWPMSNAHRTDMKPLLDENGQPSGMGGRRDGAAFPIGERHEIYWDMNPWSLTSNGDGTRLREGIPYLLAYYLGRAHGFIAADSAE